MTGGWKGAENQKQVSRSFPPALEIASAIPTFPLPRQRLLLTKGEPKKQGPTTSRSGSFFNEKMLAPAVSSKKQRLRTCRFLSTRLVRWRCKARVQSPLGNAVPLLLIPKCA